jgi:hypothetical protein
MDELEVFINLMRAVQAGLGLIEAWPKLGRRITRWWRRRP